MRDDPILVLGSSGKLGGAVARQLRAAGYTIRAATRNPDPADPAAVRFDWSSPLTWMPAVDGCRQVLLVVRPLDVTAAAIVPGFLQDCAALGVEHVVFVSALGADVQVTGPLGLVESYLRHGDLAWTILRPNFFMENFSHGWLLPQLRASGTIELAAGSGRTTFVSVEDVAAAAVKVIGDPAARGRAHDLTGDDPMSHTAVAAALTRASGRPINYVEATEDEMRRAGQRAGLPGGSLEYLLTLYAFVREGLAARKTRDLEPLLGRKPRRFDDFARDNAGAWRVTVAAGGAGA
jgi:uncharacterized protein YbjT (DUF2867 family)